MKPEEELIQLRTENQALREQLAQRDELIAQLLQRLQLLEERVAKDSHNSSLPPSSDRLVAKRKPEACEPAAARRQVGNKDTRVQRSKGARPLMR